MIEALLTPFHRDDGSVRGGRVAALAATVGALVAITGIMASVLVRTGNANAGGYAVLIALVGLKLPALGLLFLILGRQLRGAASDDLSQDGLARLEERLAQIGCAGSPGDAAALERDAWSFAHRAHGSSGSRAADIALECARLRREGPSPDEPAPTSRTG